MDVGTAIVVGGFIGGAIIGGALFVNASKDEARQVLAEERAANAQAEAAYVRGQQPQAYPAQGNAGGALNGVANVLQSLGGAAGIGSLISLVTDR